MGHAEGDPWPSHGPKMISNGFMSLMLHKGYFSVLIR